SAMMRERLEHALTSPLTDRAIALGLGGYGLYQSVHWFIKNRGSWPLIALVLSAVVKSGLTIVRRRPEKISLKPVHWVVALLACYWWPLFGGFANQGTPLISKGIASAISTVGFVLSLAVKVNLWRSFGVLPAKRQLRTRGLYGMVRHPMYGMGFITIWG